MNARRQGHALLIFLFFDITATAQRYQRSPIEGCSSIHQLTLAWQFPSFEGWHLLITFRNIIKRIWEAVCCWLIQAISVKSSSRNSTIQCLVGYSLWELQVPSAHVPTKIWWRRFS